MINDPHGNYYLPITCLSYQKTIKVWKAVAYDANRRTRGDVILKLVTVTDLKEHVLYNVIRRYYVEHPNVVAQWASFPLEGDLDSSYDSSLLCVVEEYFTRCSLLKLVNFLNTPKSVKPLTSSQIASVLYEICSGLRYLHCDMRCAHCSLTLNSVFINRESSTIKISVLEDDDDVRLFEPPKKKKIFSDPLQLALADDIWSLGVLALQIVAGNTGHSEEVNRKVIDDFSIISCSVERNVFTTSYVSATVRNFAISSELLDFICCCLRKDPSSRPNIENLMNHHLFAAGTCKDSQTRRKHMESIVHGPVYKCCGNSEEKGCSSAVSFIPKTRSEQAVDEKFNWVFPLVIADTIMSEKSCNPEVTRGLGEKGEENCTNSESKPAVSAALIPSVEDTLGIFDQLYKTMRERDISLEGARASVNLDPEAASLFENMIGSSQVATPILHDLLDQFRALSQMNPDFPVSFCNSFAAELSKGSNKQTTVNKTLSIIRTLVLLSKFSFNSSASETPVEQNAASSTPHVMERAKREVNSREPVPAFMPASTSGAVNASHYLFNKWLREKQPSIFE